MRLLHPVIVAAFIVIAPSGLAAQSKGSESERPKADPRREAPPPKPAPPERSEPRRRDDVKPEAKPTGEPVLKRRKN